jgi:hypothetical protein
MSLYEGFSFDFIFETPKMLISGVSNIMREALQASMF